MQHTTREGWLEAAKNRLSAEFFCGETPPLPERTQCSCSWMFRSAKAIGQCITPQASADGTTHILICPTQDHPIDVLGILLHEMIHAAVGVEFGHGKPFKDVMKRVGLKGKATATFVEDGTDLYGFMSALSGDLGVYPHAALSKTVNNKKDDGEEKPPRSLCMVSTEEPDYCFMISRVKYETYGAPLDPWGKEMVIREKE